MLVVADSSPIIALIHAGLVEVLPALFGEIIVPPAILSELRSPRRSDAVLQFIASAPPWLRERSPEFAETIPLLVAGETAAICLARELYADWLLIDEVEGRKAAIERQLRLTGTVGVLEQAARSGLVELDDAFDRLKQTNFWISNTLLDERLKRWHQQHPDSK